MNIFTLFLLSLSLSSDALAVSVANGVTHENLSHRKMFESAALFGIAQGLMPCLGFYFGSIFSEFIFSVQRWVMLLILGALGMNMIVCYFRDKNSEEEVCQGRLTWKIMFLQAIATSIDAFSVGIGFASMRTDIIFSSSFIAIVTFLCCFGAYLAGAKLQKLLRGKEKLVGGIILVLIGIKLFIQAS